MTTEKINIIYNEDCEDTMVKMIDEKIHPDIILTSPPYNTSRKGSSLDAACANIRYDSFDDMKSDDDYIKWTLDKFRLFDKILKPNGCILYNLSYSSENTWLMWDVVSEIQRSTNFVVADCIAWKKKSTSPNSCSPNKLTRIIEYIFVFCRRGEFYTFYSNKKITSYRQSGQAAYENIFNLIEAPNNDEVCSIHKATYSSSLCRHLIRIYCPANGLVYDPFMGTGTTAVGCYREGIRYIGSELSDLYCDYANKRIERETGQITLEQLL